MKLADKQFEHGPFNYTEEPELVMARLKRWYKVKAPQFCFEGTDMEPMPFVVEEKTTVWLCNCKHTKAKPFCDGSHNDLPDDIF